MCTVRPHVCCTPSVSKPAATACPAARASPDLLRLLSQPVPPPRHDAELAKRGPVGAGGPGGARRGSPGRRRRAHASINKAGAACSVECSFPSGSGTHLERCRLQVTGWHLGIARLPLRACPLLLLKPDQLRRPHLILERGTGSFGGHICREGGVQGKGEGRFTRTTARLGLPRPGDSSEWV